jgi:hypothetical protein
MLHKKIRTIVLLALTTSLFAFSSKFGGDSYQIYLNKKLLVKEYVSMGHTGQSFSLDKSTYIQEVDIYYSHCGQVGKERTITIRDDYNKVYRQIRYPEFDGKNSGMSFHVSDFLNWDKRGSVDQLGIYYSSKELPGGRLLATINLAGDAKTKP